MAIATTLALVSLAATTIGAGVAAYNSYQQGKAAQALNNYNADVSDQQASDAARDARIKANNQRAQAASIRARQRALFAKAGVVEGTGSPLLVDVAQAGELEMSALETEQTGNTEAARLRTQAVIDRMSGKAARTAGNLNAASTILQGLNNTADKYAKYKGI